MSRLGKLPIKLPDGTSAKIENGMIIVKGGKGELKQKLIDVLDVKISNSEIRVVVVNKKDKQANAMWGLLRSLINNMVIGVSEGFSKKLEVNGVGYRVNLSGNKLILIVGYSHPVEFELPHSISAKVDKQMVGEVSAQIRKVRKPEPYKGKGIKYVDEIIVRKIGKTAAKGE